MLAKAMDYDELESFRQFIMSGGKKGKFKWSSRDRAGTRPIFVGMSPGEVLEKNISALVKGKNLMPGGYMVAERIAAGQGRTVAYICPDGVTRDRHRKPITRTSDHIPYSFRVEGEFEKWLSAQSTPQK
jgi:hypothetical protein